MKENKNLNIDTHISLIEEWAKERNFFGEDGANITSQFVKLSEEMGELAGNIVRGRDCKDDIGDMVVVLTIIAKLKGYTLNECVEVAYNDIKDRKGNFIDNVFVKEQDLKIKDMSLEETILKELESL